MMEFDHDICFYTICYVFQIIMWCNKKYVGLVVLGLILILGLAVYGAMGGQESDCACIQNSTIHEMVVEHKRAILECEAKIDTTTQIWVGSDTVWIVAVVTGIIILLALYLVVHHRGTICGCGCIKCGREAPGSQAPGSQPTDQFEPKFEPKTAESSV